MPCRYAAMWSESVGVPYLPAREGLLVGKAIMNTFRGEQAHERRQISLINGVVVPGDTNTGNDIIAALQRPGQQNEQQDFPQEAFTKSSTLMLSSEEEKAKVETDMQEPQAGNIDWLPRRQRAASRLLERKA